MLPDLTPAERYIHIGGKGTAAHFYHANGFPIGVYQRLLQQLTPKLNLHALPMRPTWPETTAPPARFNWQIYIDDLINQIERHHDQPIIGIGHSMGASCTAIAAQQRPDLFRALVLIEPVSLPAWQTSLLRLLPFRLTARHPLIRSTLNKRDRWPNREAYLSQLSRQRPFKRIEAETLPAFGEYGIKENADQQQLVFGKQWEATNYATVPATAKVIAKLTLPTVAIRGKPSMFYPDKLWQQWQQRGSNTLFLEDFNYGHLMPLENPERCAQLILQGLEELSF